MRALGGRVVTGRGLVRALAIAALVLCGSRGLAHEPDGRIAFRYLWIAPAGGSDVKILRLIVTPVVLLEDATLSADIPKSSSVAIRPTVVGGTPIAGGWPSAGLFLGSLHAGQPLAFDLEIVEPLTGGGALSFSLSARSGGTEIREGVGITLGRPGPPAVLRGDVLEYPAEQGGKAP